MTCSWLSNSWVWARSAEVTLRVAPELALHGSRSERSRSVVTAADVSPSPSIRAVRRLATRTRSPWATTTSRPGRRPVSTSYRSGSRPSWSTRRPTALPSRSSSWRAASLTTVTVPSAAPPPLLHWMLCSNASRWSASTAISAGSRPWVCRLIRRESSQEPTSPASGGQHDQQQQLGDAGDQHDSRCSDRSRRPAPVRGPCRPARRSARCAAIRCSLPSVRSPSHDRPAQASSSGMASAVPTSVGSVDASIDPVGPGHQDHRRPGLDPAPPPAVGASVCCG